MKNAHNNLKSIISYYGGKHHLLSKILPLIPHHAIYTEVFFGGGSVFFAKEPAKIEAINDINELVVNFYKVAKRDFRKLKEVVDVTLHSEAEYREAQCIYFDSNGTSYDAVTKAWAVYVLSQQSFLNSLRSGWKFSRTRNLALQFINKRKAFDERYIKRLEKTQIFCRDALRVLRNMDNSLAFHFIDPPYIGANQGHYSGYSLEHFENLLKTCEKLKGKFLLTTYPSEILSYYAKKNGWFQIKLEMRNSASSRKGARKVEVFTMNYRPTEETISLLRNGNSKIVQN